MEFLHFREELPIKTNLLEQVRHAISSPASWFAEPLEGWQKCTVLDKKQFRGGLEKWVIIDILIV